MKAIFFEKPGGVEILQYGEFPKPNPRDGEALIRVRACGLNHLDIWLREGKRDIPLPHIPGSDVSGVIEEVKGKSSFNQGDEIIINPAIPCGTCRRCTAREPCELVKIFGAKTLGGYAEYVVAPISQLYPKPKNLSFIEAAAFPLTFLTAWHMLITRAKLKAGETVFIWGASGGLGTSAIQIAKFLGAKIIAATQSEQKAKLLRNIGADGVVIYTQEKVVDRVKELTEGRGVDVVFESVGEKTWNTSLAMLCPFGRVVIAGTTSGDIGSQDLSDIYVRQISILGARMGTQEEFEKVLELISQDKIKPIIDKVFPLSQARQAQQRMEERKHFGKIVLQI